MIEVTDQKVTLIAEPTVRWGAVRSYLAEVGGESWVDKVLGARSDRQASSQPTDAELLVEIMGRICYRSWEPGLNRNVTKVREDHGDYLLNVLRQAHGSVLAHAHFSFLIHDCSRVMTAELNRHAAGIDISEQSLRYVRLDELRFRVPTVLKPETQDIMRLLITHIEEEMAVMIQTESLDDPELDFSHKKTITSALRRGAPLGLLTEEGWTANVRAIRHVIEMRSAQGAEEEIRVFADQLARIMQARCPLLFGDYESIYTRDQYEEDNFRSPPAWQTDYRKV